jgi:hypothetical protein
MGDVVEEVEVVHEARRLGHAQAQERVHAAGGRVEDLHGVARLQPRLQLGRQPTRDVGLVTLPAGRADRRGLAGEQHAREHHAHEHQGRQRTSRPP